MKLTSAVQFLTTLLFLCLALPLPGHGDSGSSREWGYQALYAWVRHVAGEVEYPEIDHLRPLREADPQFKKAVAAYF